MPLLREFKVAKGWVRSLAFSPDGRYLVSGANHGIQLWEVKSGKELRVFPGANTGVAFSPDGKLVLGGRPLRDLVLWEAATGNEVRRFEPHEGKTYCVAFSPDRVLSGGGLIEGTQKAVPGGFLRLWDSQTGKEIRRFHGHKGPVVGVFFTPDGKRAISFSKDGNRRLWDLETGNELWRHGVDPPLETREENKGGASWPLCPDGKHFLAGLSLCDIQTGEVVREYKPISTGRDTSTTASVAISPDGKRLVSGDKDGLVRVWDVATGEELCHVFGHVNGAAVLAVAISPDGRTAASCGSGSVGFESLQSRVPMADHVIRLWKLPE